VAQHHGVDRQFRREPGDRRADVRGRPRPGQVQPGQRQPGVGGVHVRIHERRSQQRAVQLHDVVGGRGVGVGTEPVDPAVPNQQCGGLWIGRTVQPAATVESRGVRHGISLPLAGP
jgi:hypothetical protein